MKKYLIFLFLIFILGLGLRIYRLGEIPVGFHKDEAFLGYNAYSILKTGHDINGNFLPLHLKSFLYSPAGYSYFSIPFINIFGLSPFSVRFASALFGSLTILTTYFLVKNGLSQIGKRNNFDSLALLSAFLLAINPWHINLSRTATENTLVVFFISLGLFLYLAWIQKKKYYFLLISFLFFSITLFLYQAPRAFLPLFLPLFLILLPNLRKKELLQFFSLFLVLIIIPLSLIFSSKDLSLRIRTVSVFSTEQTQLLINQQIGEDGVAGTQNKITRIFHNKVLGYSSQILENYFKHFSYTFLFTDQGLPERYKVPNIGLLYLIELPFLILGAWFLFKKDKKIAGLLLGWILLTPLGSALTFDDVPNLQRTLIIFPALTIIIAFGFLGFFSLIKGNFARRTLFFSVSFLLFFNVLFYLHEYYIHASVYRPWIRQEGYEELVASVNKLLPDYKKAVITDRDSSPTIFFLLYGKYDPSLFQKQTKGTKMKDFDRINFANYEFSQEQCPLTYIKKEGETTFTGEKNVLYVNSGLCDENVGNTEVLRVIKRLDGSTAFRILKTIN